MAPAWLAAARSRVPYRGVGNGGNRSMERGGGRPEDVTLPGVEREIAIRVEIPHRSNH